MLGAGAGGLVFTDVRRNQLLVLKNDGTAEPLRDPSGKRQRQRPRRRGAARHLRAPDPARGAPGGGRKPHRSRPTGFEGKPLNSPNDAVLASDGAIWFTDPVFGIRQPDEGLQAEPEQSARRVYRIDPSGRLDAMVDTLDQPNGIAFSPDGRTLYVAESGAAMNPEGPRGVVAFPIQADGRPARDAFSQVSRAVCPTDLQWTRRAVSMQLRGRRARLRPRRRLARAHRDAGSRRKRRLRRRGRPPPFVASCSSIHAIDLKVRGL